MTFEEKLRKTKKNLKTSSVNTYLRNIRRLRRAVHTDPIPSASYEWLLEKKLGSWFEEQPLNVRRHMATAAQVALQVYGKTNDAWKERQKKAMKEFDEKRKGRDLSEKQKKLVPKQGFDSLKKIARDMTREFGHILKTSPAEWSLSDLLKVQDLLIVSLYHNIPMRLDYATLKVGEKSGNAIFKSTKKPRGWHVTLTDFKTEKSLGPQKFKPNVVNQRLLNKFIPATERLTDHGFLLSNRSGKKMSKQVLSKRLMKITKARIGKGFGVQFMRILYAMQNRKVLETAKEVAQKLMHNQSQSILYSKK